MKNNGPERLFIRKIGIMKHIDETINKVRTIDELNEMQNRVEQLFDMRRRVLNLVEEANKMNGKSFGYLKESFENLSTKLYKTSEGKAIMKRYTQAIKENKSLTSLHKLYENIRKAHNDMDLDYFVGSICETDWNVKKNELAEGVKKLAGIVAEGYVVVGEAAKNYVGTVNDKLDGAIEFIAENKTDKKNIVKYSEAVKVIREAAEKNGNISDSFNKDTDLDKTIQDLVKKFSDNEETDGKDREQAENNIVRGGEEETVFRNKKTDCLDSISEAIKKYEADGDKEEVETLQKIHEQITAKEYNAETLGSDICNFIEMTKLFE